MTPPHTHTFLFATGGGNGVMCALGRGRYISKASRSKQTLEFLDLIQRMDGAAAVRPWTLLMLDPRESPKVMSVIEFLNPSPATTVQQYTAWRDEWSDPVPIPPR